MSLQFNPLPHRTMAKLIITLALVLGTTSLLQAQTLIANYPLTTNSNDATGNFGPITYGSTATQAPNACGDGTVTTGAILTPTLASKLNITNFQVSMTFKANSLATTSRRPIFMLDNSYRAFGVTHNSAGLIQLNYNNAQVVASTTSITTGRNYTLTAKYVAPFAEIYLDGVLILSTNIGSPLAFNPNSTSTWTLCNYHGGNAQYSMSCWSDVRIYSGGVTLAENISNVTSSNANGTYKIGDLIPIQVSFPSAVTVNTTGGTPQLTLETGSTDRNATYASGSGTSTLTFNYTVQAGDNTADLDYTSTSALIFNGGTIKDATGESINPALPTPGAAGSLGANRNIVIDGVAPTVSISSTVGASGATTSGSPIPFTITFSENVSNFAVGDISLGNGTVNTFSGSGTSYSLTVNPSAAGNVSVSISSGVANDAAGNTNTASSTFTINYQNVLPLELISFKARSQENNVRLEWATQWEQENASFGILRSADGKDFLPLTTVAANGNSTGRKDYFFLDRSPLQGESYYKLIQTDRDGKKREIGLRSIKFSISSLSTLSLYPNPSATTLNISFPQGTHRITISDSSGKTVASFKVTGTATLQHYNVSKLPSATYLVQSYGSYGLLSQKLVKAN